MKNFFTFILRPIGAFLLLLYLALPLTAQQVVKVGAGEYLTVYLMSDKTVKVSSQSTITPILKSYPGLDSIIDVQGGQYHVTALDEQGKVYKLDKYATSVMTAVDEFGADFTGNFQVKGFWQSNVSLRGVDSSLWYWGIADPMNYRAGATITAPIKLNMPAGKKFKKVETGASSALTNSYILAIASDNTVWRYDRGNATPYQITIGGETFVDIATLGSQAQVLQTASNKLFAAGYYSTYAGTPTNTSTFTNVTTAWVNAGVVFPIKELVGNSSTLHIIDANNNMFGSGTNVQGEVGTGVEYSPYRIAGPQGGVFGYGFTNGVLLTPPTQIQGKFKNLNTSTTITFYLYVQDLGNNWYSWGRNKSFSLGNGKSIGPYAGWGGIGDYAAYPNAMDVPMPKRINPASVVWVLQNFDPNASQPPVAGAGINQYLSAVSSTTLYGKAFQQEFSISGTTWTKVSGPTGGNITNPNNLNTTITSLQNGTYVYRLTATNSNGQISTDDVSIIVTSTNTPPTVNAGSDQTLTLPTSATTLNGVASDIDGSISSYQWAKISGPAGGTIASALTASTGISALQAGLYSFTLTVTDNAGATALDTIQVTVNAAANQAPTANAGTNINITLPTNSTNLSGGGTDPDGTIASYVWLKISGPATGTLTNANAATATASGLVQGVYSYQLTVVDNQGALGRDTVTVTVNAAANQAPTANAGTNINITLPTNSTNLSGSGTDPDGTIASYAWLKISGPATGTLTNANAATATASGLIQGVYSYQLTVVDNQGALGRDTVTVTVNAAANQAPTANAGTNINITLPTNSTNLSGGGTDPDGTIASYAWLKISGPATGTLTNANAATATASGLIQGVYSYQLTVVDNQGALGRDTVTVTVNAAANQAPTANAGTNINITLPTNSTNLSGGGTDPDGTIASYAWLKISGPATGTLTNANAATATASGLIQGVYSYQLTVVDNQGALSRDTVTVTVNAAANQAPTANAGTNINITLPTNSTNLSGGGTDPDGTIASYVWLKISGPATGTLTNANAATATASGLVQGVYSYQLTVIDNQGALGRDTVTVTVNAAANQAPTANAGTNINITLPTNSTNLSGSGTDPDGTIASYAWLKISGPATGTLTNANAATATASGLIQGVYSYQLTVVDNQGALGRDTVTVTVNAAANQAPTANAGTNINITLPTNSTNLSGGGTDPDGTIASYAWLKISGPATGTLTNANAATATASGLIQGVYSYQLTVIDNQGALGRDTVTVTVNAAANQAPTANAGTNINITLPTNSTNLSGGGTDPDGTIASYVWLKISGPATGTLTNANAATATASGLVQGVYSYQLTVIDNQGALGRDTVTVTVNAAANQAPTANAGTNINITLPTNSTNLSGSGTDPDGTIASYAWLKISGPATGTLTNANAATATASGLIQGVYSYQLTVVDNQGALGRDTVTVTVNAAANQAPTANAGTNINITLPTNSTNLSGSGTDPDGTIASYVWLKISGPATGTLTNANAATATASGLIQGVYSYQLTVIDNQGALGRDTVTVTVNAAANIAPTANAGENISIYLPEDSVNLNGVGTTSQGGYITTYNWKVISSQGQYFITNPNLSQTRLNNLEQGVYIIEFSVTDNVGARGYDTITVTVGSTRQQMITSEDVNIFPNPVNSTLNAEIHSPKTDIEITLVLFDVKGVKIYQREGKLFGNTTKEIIDMSKLKAGIYILQVNYGNKNQVVKKVIKM